MQTYHKPRQEGTAWHSDTVSTLADAISEVVQSSKKISPEQKRNISDVYIAAGQSAAAAVQGKCFRVMKDPNHGVHAKINSVRILDLLMELQNDALAYAMAVQMQFFTNISIKLKEKDKRKRRPGVMFSLRADDEDVTKFISAVCEYLDKWGRYYENAPPGSLLHNFVRARQDMLQEEVVLPSPQSYRWLKPHQDKGFNEGDAGRLDDEALQRYAEDVRTSTTMYGPSAPETLEVRARFESELSRWQRAAQEAAERKEYNEFEKLSAVAYRYAAISQSFDSTAATLPTEQSPFPGPRDASQSPYRHADTVDRVDSEQIEPNQHSPSHIERRRHRVRKGSKHSTTPRSQQFAFPADGDFSARAQDREPHSATPMPNGGGFRTVGSLSFETTPPSPAAPPNFSDGTFSAPYAYNGGFMGTNPVDVALQQRCAELEAEVESLRQSLRAQLDSALQRDRSDKGNIGELSRKLHDALKRIQELEPLERELAKARASLIPLQEANLHLQNELDRCHMELRQAQQRAKDAEKKTTDRDDLISKTRQRLFDEKSHSAKLEDEIKDFAEVHQSLQTRLQASRTQQAASERQLQQLRGHLDKTSSIQYQNSDESVRRRNVSYVLQGQTQDQGSGLTSPLPTVNQVDELASAGRSENMIDRPLATNRPAPVAPIVLHRSLPEVWAQTLQLVSAKGAIVSRTPPAGHECIRQTHERFRGLLSAAKGLLYEDERIAMDIAVRVVTRSKDGRPKLELTITISNPGNHQLEHVCLTTPQTSQPHACKLQLERLPKGPHNSLPRQQQIVFQGQLEVFGPFELGPKVELSYLLPDDLCQKVCLRLPLAITRFMSGVNLEAGRFIELWESAQFAHTEVAVVCNISPALLQGMGASYSMSRYLELGGALCCLPCLDECTRSIALASSYPQHFGISKEVLVRVELGGPGGPTIARPYSEPPLCRISVRSASHLVNKALLNVMCELLCDAGELKTKG